MLTDEERYFAETVIGAIDNIDCPMLMYEGEKEIVRTALERLLSEDESERRGRWGVNIVFGVIRGIVKIVGLAIIKCVKILS